MDIKDISSFIDIFKYSDSLLPFGEFIVITTFLVSFMNFRQKNTLIDSLRYSLFLSSISSIITLAMGITTPSITIAVIILTSISIAINF